MARAAPHVDLVWQQVGSVAGRADVRGDHPHACFRRQAGLRVGRELEVGVETYPLVLPDVLSGENRLVPDGDRKEATPGDRRIAGERPLESGTVDGPKPNVRWRPPSNRRSAVSRGILVVGARPHAQGEPCDHRQQERRTNGSTGHDCSRHESTSLPSSVNAASVTWPCSVTPDRHPLPPARMAALGHTVRSFRASMGAPQDVPQHRAAASRPVLCRHQVSGGRLGGSVVAGRDDQYGGGTADALPQRARAAARTPFG